MANEFVFRKGLISLGGVEYPYRQINDSNYTIGKQVDYYIDVVASTADRTLTLPGSGQGMISGQTFVIKNNVTSANDVILGTIAVDGVTNYTLKPSETIQIVFNGTSYIAAGINGTSGSSGSSGSAGTSGSSGSSGTSGSSGSSGTSGEGLCNGYKVDNASLPDANGEIQFVGGLTTATQINIFDTNSDAVDWTEYYEMIVGRKLSGTLTITEFNDTDSYIVYEFNGAGTSFGSNRLTINPTSVYASPLVDTTNAPVGNVCIQFDLFRGGSLLDTATPTGGVIVSTGDLYSATTQGQIIVQDSDPQITMSGLTNVVTYKESGITTGKQLYSFNQSLGDGAIIEYVVQRTDGTVGLRTGQIIAVWSGSSTQAAQTSSRDVGGSTAGLELSVTADGTNVYINSVISSGTYNITLHVRLMNA